MEELKAAVFEKEELEFRNMPILKTLLPFFAYQSSDPDVKKNFMILRNE